MNLSKRKRTFILVDFIMIVILIAIDQFTKYLAVVHLKDKPAYSIIDNVFEGVKVLVQRWLRMN